MATPNLPQEPSRSGSSNRRWIVLGGVAVVVLAVAGGLFWFFSGDTPEEASIEGALGAVQTTTEAPDTTGAPDSSAVPETTAAPETTTAPADGDVSGTWTVDTSIGDFTFEEATGSFVGFRINEELASIGTTEAVGRTPEVAGTLTIDDATITAVDVEANMDAIVTDDSRRDSRARGALDTTNFPTATFTLTEPIDLGGAPVEGETVEATAVGELTIRGTTNPVEFAMEAQLAEGLIVVVGSTEIVFADYGVEVPSAPIVLSVEDSGVVELQLWFSR